MVIPELSVTVVCGGVSGELLHARATTPTAHTHGSLPPGMVVIPNLFNRIQAIRRVIEVPMKDGGMGQAMCAHTSLFPCPDRHGYWVDSW